MSAADLHALRTSQALRPTTHLDRLAHDHVRFDSVLDGAAEVEKSLWEELHGHRACVAVVGPSGAGKSSVIASVLAHLERAHRYLALVVRAGNAGDALKGSGDFALFVLREIVSLLDVADAIPDADRAALVAAAADKFEETAPQTVGTARLGLPLVVDIGLSAQLRGAITKHEHLKNPTTSIDGLQRAIEAIIGAGRQPVLVIDDTDKFAGAETGQIDEDAATGLFGHGLPLLGGIHAHVVIAVHPRFRELATYKNAAKHFTAQVEIPDLLDPRALIRAILAKRMTHAGVNVDPDAIFAADALAYLEAWYGSRQQDLRTILRIADQAVSAAALAKASTVDREHVLLAARNVRALPY